MIIYKFLSRKLSFEKELFYSRHKAFPHLLRYFPISFTFFILCVNFVELGDEGSSCHLVRFKNEDSYKFLLVVLESIQRIACHL